MKKPYYILGTLEEVAARSQSGPGIAGPSMGEDSGRKLYFHGGRDIEINGQTYLIVPLSEIAELFGLQVEDFLEDEMLDAINRIKQQVGYNPIVNA
ncbi:MAG: hypothetical protein IH594_12815 [Bacteroidales bacterium]|nr:hypothetical protein [Bacteroidales bacterium]